MQGNILAATFEAEGVPTTPVYTRHETPMPGPVRPGTIRGLKMREGEAGDELEFGTRHSICLPRYALPECLAARVAVQRINTLQTPS